MTDTLPAGCRLADLGEIMAGERDSRSLVSTFSEHSSKKVAVAEEEGKAQS